MKVLVDMSLSPSWRELFEQHGIEALHWSQVGNAKAKDREISGPRACLQSVHCTVKVPGTPGVLPEGLVDNSRPGPPRCYLHGTRKRLVVQIESGPHRMPPMQMIGRNRLYHNFRAREPRRQTLTLPFLKRLDEEKGSRQGSGVS